MAHVQTKWSNLVTGIGIWRNLSIGDIDARLITSGLEVRKLIVCNPRALLTVNDDQVLLLIEFDQAILYRVVLPKQSFKISGIQFFLPFTSIEPLV